MNNVINIVETVLPNRSTPWWLVRFFAPCTVRLVEPTGSLSDLMEPHLKLRWAVHAPRNLPRGTGTQWERFVVGVQPKAGLDGAPSDFLSWQTQWRPLFGLVHVFAIGPEAGSEDPETAPSTLPVTPWTNP